jgi:transposase
VPQQSPFLRRLTKDAGQKVVLIVDNLKVHKTDKVRAWVESHGHEIELCYLPPYAPDHNPTEYLNNDLKQRLRQQPLPGSKEELIGRTRSVLRTIQRSPGRVRAYFRPGPSATPRRHRQVSASRLRTGGRPATGRA